MCHAVRVTISSAEAKQVRKLYGYLVPLYASVALFLLAAVVFSHGPRSGEAVAVLDNAMRSSAAPTAAR